MSNFLNQTWGTLTKDVRQWSRDRQAAVGPMLVPLVLMLICTVLFGYGGDEWNIGLIVEGEGPEAHRLAAVITDLHGNISPYFRVITRERAEAERLVSEGRLQFMITIPADFDALVAAGKPPRIETRIFNINTDMTKNIRLRLDRALVEFAMARGTAPLRVVQTTTREQDVWRRSFIAAGALAVALLVGASLNTAIMAAREWDRQTVKEVRLAPHAVWATGLGKVLAGLVATAANVTVTLVVAVTLFGLQAPVDRWLSAAGFGALVAIAGAGLGLGLGAWLRDYRTLQPLLLVTVAGSFFASGGYGNVATLPPAVRAFDAYWPPAFVFETLHALLHMPILPDLSAVAWILPLAVVSGLAFGLGLWRRSLSA